MDAAASAFGPDPRTPLEQFRARPKRLRLHPLETLLLLLVGANVALLPWAFGGIPVWAQGGSLALSAMAFAVALVPRLYTEDHTGADRFRLIMWPRLAKLPLFWLGLALLGYVLIQALNPAWRQVGPANAPRLEPLAHVAWLPAGVDAPFAQWGPWRMLVVYATAWLAVCALWIGVTRRVSVHALFIVIAVNGLGVAALGVAQRLVGTLKIYGTWEPPVHSFFASFLYKNHAGAFLILALAAAWGLAVWYFLRGRRQFEKSNPSGLFAFFAVAIAIAIWVSQARGATLVLFAFAAGSLAGWAIDHGITREATHRPVAMLTLGLVFAAFLAAALGQLDSDQAWTRLVAGVTRQDRSLAVRERVTHVALDMLGEHWVRGVGAGAFPLAFPPYRARDPLLPPGDGSNPIWEQAHNDILQFPIELGLVGSLLLLGAVGYVGVVLVREKFWANPVAACAVFAAALLVVYSWWDHLFRCPAILLTWWTLVTGAALWARFDRLSLEASLRPDRAREV